MKPVMYFSAGLSSRLRSSVMSARASAFLPLDQVEREERALEPLEGGLVGDVVAGEVVLDIGADGGGERRKLFIRGDEVGDAALDRVGVAGKIVELGDLRLGGGLFRLRRRLRLLLAGGESEKQGESTEGERAKS